MIRPLTPNDLPWVVQTETAIFSTTLGAVHYEALVQLGGLFGYVYDTHQPVAALICSFNEEHCQIENLFVLPQEQNKGIGKQLLQQLMKELAMRHLRYVSLDVRVDHNVAIHLYESMEFQSLQRIPQYYPDKSDAIRMVYERSLG
jgi:ribosomal-protein-alanine N-acetyltransferase